VSTKNEFLYWLVFETGAAHELVLFATWRSIMFCATQCVNLTDLIYMKGELPTCLTILIYQLYKTEEHIPNRCSCTKWSRDWSQQ
jgi:hypothetical protein